MTILFIFYVGLLVFGLNGIIWAARRQQELVITEHERRLRQLLMRVKLRNRR